jgi:hypothetical protein
LATFRWKSIVVLAIPTFDLFAKTNPFASLEGFPGIDHGGNARHPSRAEYRHPLSVRGSEPIDDQVLPSAVSGLSYVLGTLDKPGQAVRGVLAGKGLSSLKDLVQFSDTIGLTSEAVHTTGRDLTDKLGLTSKVDKGWGAWGTGLAADFLTYPLTYSGVHPLGTRFGGQMVRR